MVLNITLPVYPCDHRNFGHYTQTVGEIFLKDVHRFVFLFGIFLFAFSAALHLSLRGEVSTECNQTSTDADGLIFTNESTCVQRRTSDEFPLMG